MAKFPLAARPKESYHENPRNFGALRDHGARKHAGCDLYAPPGTPIRAMEDGVVIRGPYLFYDVVFAIEVQHPSGIIRYGEISKVAEGVKVGSQVKAGQVIAYVGKMVTVPQSMLHLEMYSNAADVKTQLTDRTRAGFQRRKDLIDPTAFLDAAEV